MSENDETVALEDEIQNEEEFVFEEDSETNDPLDSLSDPEELRAAAKKYRGIATRKASSKAKAPEAPAEEQKDEKTDTSQINKSEFLTRDEGILIAEGYDTESIEQLSAIAKGKGISLLDARKDPLFEAYEAKKKDEKRKADAKLSASNSSGRTPRGKPVGEMTREEHEAYWRERTGL